ncbi:MAG: hypothetical protein ACO3GO_01970 [Terrimicrobiaceae bacterium]
MALRKVSSPTKVTDAQRQLDKEQLELKKREAQLTKLLVKIPKEIEKKNKTRTKLPVEAAHAISLGGARVSRAPQPVRRGKTRLSKDANAARVKFLVLCIILLTIVVMLWRTIPS